MIIDAHHHLWEDLTRRDYDWLAGLDPIRRPYAVAEYLSPAERDEVFAGTATRAYRL